MGRIPRWRQRDGIYHVYNRSLGKMPILRDPEAKDRFVDILRRKLEKSQLNVYHYCIMNTHFHLAVEVLDMKDLSTFISGLSSSYCKYFRQSGNLGNGPLWQGRYRSILVQKEKYLLNLARYIEQNPVRAGAVATPEEWRWSSAHAYFSGESDGIVNPTEHPLLSEKFSSAAEREMYFKNFWDILPEEDMKLFHSSINAIGDDDFLAKVRNTADRTVLPAGRPRKIKYQ